MPHPKPPTIATATTNTNNKFKHNYSAHHNGDSPNYHQPPLDRLRNKARKFLLKKRKERYYKALEQQSSIYSPTDRNQDNLKFGIVAGGIGNGYGNGFYSSPQESAHSFRSRSSRGIRSRSIAQRFHFNNYSSKSTSESTLRTNTNTSTPSESSGAKREPRDSNTNTDSGEADNLSPLLADKTTNPIPNYSSVQRARVTTPTINSAGKSFFDSRGVNEEEKDKKQAQAEPQSTFSSPVAASHNQSSHRARSYSDYDSSRQHQREQQNTFHRTSSGDSTDSFLKITFTTDSGEAFEAVDERLTLASPPTATQSKRSLLKEEYISSSGSSSEDEEEELTGIDQSLRSEDISYADNSTEYDVLNGSNSKDRRSLFEEYDRSNQQQQREHLVIKMTNGNHSNSASGGTNASNTTRRKILKCMHYLTQNSVTTCIFRIPTVADCAMSSNVGIILDNPKMAFVGLVSVCMVVDMIIILPGYLCAKFMTEFGVYLFTFATIWYLGRCVLRMIAFPGSTPRLRGEVETEFAKYSVRMMKNAVESCADLASLLISMESASMYSMENGKESAVHGVNASVVLGSSYGRFDVIPLWKKASQYRDRVLGMYHDILHCLLTNNGDGKISQDDDLVTKYGNNPLVGDIGNLVSVSEKAKASGMELHGLLGKLLEELETLENCASGFLNSDMKSLEKQALPREAIRSSQRLLVACSALHDKLESMYALFEPGALSNDNDSDDGVRKSPMSEGLSAAKEGFNGMLELIDPPPFKSIFGLDSLRGAVLSRYRGSQQFWVPRPKVDGGGMIDAIYVPADGKTKNLNDSTKLEKVVLFCNPNAGLLEVATGLSIIGGNVVQQTVETASITSWTDFYLESGFDIILFNYTGYGRSHFGKRKAADYSSGVVQFLKRMLIKIFFAFKPSPSTLKADATAVATYILEKIGVDKLVMHGESIGGMAASGASRIISNRKYLDTNSVPISYPSLLIADRTFCNLDATASRLVGSWTDSVIPILTPFWNTDVAGDFAAARCKKVVAQDAADAIIHDASSLKKGISTAKEFMKESTKSVHNVGELPVSYRMSDHENVGVLESSIIKAPHLKLLRPPEYPADKHINLSEAFHFAACSRRIGKVATQVKKNKILSSISYDDEEGIEIPAVFSRDDSDGDVSAEKEDVIVEVWEALARCDGLTGMPLGGAVKEGYDSVLDWLSCLVTLGCQRVALAAESRIKKINSTSHVPYDEVITNDEDFDFYYPEYDKDDDMERLPPLPLPDVIKMLQDKFSDNKELLNGVKQELDYCIKMLEYVMNRISCSQTVTSALKVAHFQDAAISDGFSTGRFLILSCGHNNQYSVEERINLNEILNEALEYDNSLA